MSNLTQWQQENTFLVERGIDEPTWAALCNTVYPGANPESVVMAIDYCKARGLDPMLKPVHLVPMKVKNAQTGNSDWRDVAMPGVGLYRIQASRSGDYAGADEPVFGPTIVRNYQSQYDGEVEVCFPEWCKYSVHKIIGDRVVTFSAKEFWLENYATASAKTDCPNAMWKKRPFAQLAKCAEAQALRKAWPEIGQEATAEEMQGKDYHYEREINPTPQIKQVEKEISEYSQADFDANFPKWEQLIKSGKKTPEQIIALVSSKGEMTGAMIDFINSVEVEKAA
jgi:phage recombination protein Bet